MRTSLPLADVEQLLDLVGTLSRAASVQSLREQTVSLLPQLIPAILTSWNEVDLPSGTTTVVSDESGPPDPDLFARFEANIATHPVVQHVARTGDGRPYTISDFVTEEQFHASAIYQDVYRYMDTEDQLSCVLPDPDVVVGIAFNREARSFGSRERTLLNLCRPHLIRARRAALAYERTQWYLHTLERLVERSGEGLVLVDDAGRIAFASPNAQNLLHTWFDVDGLEHLPAPLARWLAAPVGAFALHHDDRTLDLDRLPGPEPTVAAILLRASGPGPDAQAALRRVGLTSREGEVVLLAAYGRPNATIAAQLCISVRTVEKHMQLAMHKLGVTNRVQAAALVRDLRLQPISD